MAIDYPVPGLDYIGDGRYQVKDDPHLIINTKYCAKNEEENKKVWKNIADAIEAALIHQELLKMGLDWGDVL